MTAHRIASVQFQRMADEGRPMSEAPLRCTCGETVTSGTWDAHRGPTATMQRVARNHAAWKERAA